MKVRVLPLLLATLALLFFATAPAWAADKDEGNSHQGKVVSVSGNKLVMTDLNGKNQHTMILADAAKVSCDGKSCTLSDLKPGMRIRVTTKQGDKKTAIRIEATKGEGK